MSRNRKQGRELPQRAEAVAVGLLENVYGSLPLREATPRAASRLSRLSDQFIATHREEIERMLVEYADRFGYPASSLVSEALAERFMAFVQGQEPESKAP